MQQTSKQLRPRVHDNLPAKTPRLVAASKSTRHAEELIVAMTLEGHERLDPIEEENSYPHIVPISYVAGGEQLISGSRDKTARTWDLQTGKEINEARLVCETEFSAVAVSRDDRWVITAGGNRYDLPNVPELKAWEIKTGIMKTLKGHLQTVTCIDISADSKLLASGSMDETVRIWDLDTSKLVAGPLRPEWVVGAVRFSQDSMKLAVNSDVGKHLQVWDIQGQKLDRRIGKQGPSGQITYAPVFWTTNDKSIVVAFTFKSSPHDDPRTIYEFDASTLDTIGVPFEGHTEVVTGLALSFDCALLASASYDNTIKLWNFESRQLLASFDIRHPYALILSPDLRHVAYTTDLDLRICICNVPSNILASIRSAQDAQSTSSLPNTPPRDDLLSSDATRRRAAVHPAPVISFTPLPHRPSRTVHQHQPAFLRTLRKFIPSFYRNALPRVGNDESHDPLDFPAPSSFPLNQSLSAQAVTHAQSGVHSDENSLAAAVTQLSAATIKVRLLDWWRIHTGRVPPPIVDVPLAQGKKRNAAAGAPKGNDDYVLDENFDSRPPSPNPNSQLPSAAAQTNPGEHGNSWSCFCL